MTFNKFGVTLHLEESATDNYVIDLIPGCVDLISDDTTRENVYGLVRRLQDESVKDSGTSAEFREFSILIFGPEKVTIIDVDKLRIPFVRWIVRNLVVDGPLKFF